MRGWPLLIAALTLLAPSAAAGQDDAEPPAEYQSAIDSALRESADGHWEEARAYFHRAHAAYPNARTLRGIGVVSFELRDYVDAVRHLRALDEERRALTDAQRAEVEELLARAGPRVARYELDALPDGAELIVDGHPPFLERDSSLLLAIGTHEVRVRGAAEGRASIVVRGGETGPLPIVVDATPERGERPSCISPGWCVLDPDVSPTGVCSMLCLNDEGCPFTEQDCVPTLSDANHCLYRCAGDDECDGDLVCRAFGDPSGSYCVPEAWDGLTVLAGSLDETDPGSAP